MALDVGTRLGPYEVTSLIGVGGMGEVYRAHDSSLHRDVALKVLPDLFAADPERLARFRREAQVLASLNHPNIAAIYGFAEGQALVMELVEGPTLADRIAQGPVPLDEGLPIASQIADALQNAHEHGIVHRDLKPANIKVRPDGTVKVLDFGLAKALESEVVGAGFSRPDTMSPTITSPATGLGVILGTAAYMSPEQARGKAVDRRTDIWAFGCVLYEMLSARRTFDGDEVSDVLAFILTKQPDWSALPPATPTAIRRLLQRCLQKDRGRRLDSAADVRLEIDEALAAPSDAERPPRFGMLHRPGVAWAAAAVFAVALLAVLASSRLGIDSSRPPQDAQPIRFVVSPPEGWRWRLGGTSGFTAIAPMAISPDGRRVAIEAVNSEGTTQIWVRSLETLDAQPLAGVIGGFAPFWSPDSRFVGFFADGKLKKIDVFGGPPITLSDAPTPQGGSWNQNGVIVFAPAVDAALQKVSASGGVPASASSLTTGEAGHRRPSFLPDGRHFLFSANPTSAGGQRPVYLAAVDSPDRTELLMSDSTNVLYSQGHLLYLSGTTLMAHPFDAQRLQLTGEPIPLAEDVQTNGVVPNALFSVSASGVLVYSTGNSGVGQLLWFDRAGMPLGLLADWGAYNDLELAPDGKRASFSLPDPSRRSRDIWIFDIDRGLRTRFSFDPANESSSAWSPDGRELIFSSDRRGHVDLYRKLSNGAGSEELLFEDDGTKWVQSWSADGGAVLFFTPASEGGDLFVLPLSGTGKPTPLQLQQTAFTEIRGRFSPDGRWVAYQSNESVSRGEVYVASLAAGGGKWQISTAGGSFPRWRRDGAEIFYLAPDNRLMAASVNGKGSSFEVGAVTPLFETRAPSGGGYQYDVSADGRRFLVNSVREADSTPVTVVVNWIAELKE